MFTYNNDFYSWAQEQARLLRQGRFSELDSENLIEEIEDMGRSEKRELESRLVILLAHLLKWCYQPDHRSNSWEGSIGEQRIQTKKCLRENPSLKTKLPEIFQDAYETGRFQAMKETNLKLDIFPEECLWTIEQVLDNRFFPENYLSVKFTLEPIL